MLILAVSTSKNKYVEEWEKSMKQLGYKYEILGIGEPWEGFNTKMKLIIDKLKTLNSNEIVAVTDAYDLLFLRGPQIMLKTYNKLAKGKILVGADKICIINCDNISVSTCKINNYNNKNHINGGFVIGPANKLINMYMYSLKHGDNDDQIGISRFYSKNCNEIVLDYNGEIVLNLWSDKFNGNTISDLNITNKIFNVENRNYPIVVHFPNQAGDLGVRSEIIRNFLFKNRKKKSIFEYLEENIKHEIKSIQYPVYQKYIWIPLFSIGIIILISFIFYYKNKSNKNK